MKMLVYTILTALITSGWWYVLSSVHDNPFVVTVTTFLIPVTLAYLIWLIESIINEWEH